VKRTAEDLDSEYEPEPSGIDWDEWWEEELWDEEEPDWEVEEEEEWEYGEE